MRSPFLAAVLAAALVALQGSAAHHSSAHRATGTILGGAWTYLPGSVLPVRVDGFAPPYRVALVGPGSMLDGGSYQIPQTAAPGTATLLAASSHGLAQKTIRIGEPPGARQPLLAVASYDDGIVLHRAADFSVDGVLAIGGPPGDVAADSGGRVVGIDTQGDTLTSIAFSPWRVSRVPNVLVGDEVAIDPSTRAVFVTNRDVDGSGALTRILPGGDVTRVATGQTAEGLAIDARRRIVYVANVNDDTIAEVDADTMRPITHFRAVSRIFSLELSPDGTRLFGVSNQSASPPLNAPGSVVAFAVGGRAAPRVVARSSNLDFPLGEALDAATSTLFVTDEAADDVYVLDARTLRPKHVPLRTCRTPWKPAFDARGERLYVPCARADAVDVFDARSYKRIAGAPFATGGYPLAVAVRR